MRDGSGPVEPACSCKNQRGLKCVMYSIVCVSRAECWHCRRADSSFKGHCVRIGRVRGRSGGSLCGKALTDSSLPGASLRRTWAGGWPGPARRLRVLDRNGPSPSDQPRREPRWKQSCVRFQLSYAFILNILEYNRFTFVYNIIFSSSFILVDKDNSLNFIVFILLQKTIVFI